MGNEGEGKKVCVTGASGYIASWIIKLLLDRGYTIHATVRDLKDKSKVNHLLTLDGAKERLHLFESNLSEEGSFDSAIHGCDGVFHAASPVKINTPNPQEELVDPAVNGVLNVLTSCSKSPSVKRVVFTSSMASVIFNEKTLGPEVIIDETWFTDIEFSDKSMVKWYVISKTLAEEAAWKFVKEKGIDMVTINPSVTIGPSLTPTPCSSLQFVFSLINGSETYPNKAIGWVHVIDVAKAHIMAFETPSAKGRYLLTESVSHLSQTVEILRELDDPDLKLPQRCVNNNPFEPVYKVSQEKVRSLGIDYIPFKTTLKDTIQWFKEKHLVSN